VLPWPDWKLFKVQKGIKMKVVVTADGGYMTSKFCPHFEECEHIIIYDLDDRLYGSRVSPSFKTKDKAVLIDFLQKTFMTHIITGKDIGDSPFSVYIPKNMDATVEDVLIEYMNSLS
jgi:predicted Fe-Mo cluster-binding NifX family protein